ncbi:asparagine synthase (glutamine-hydrolyzing) [Hyunsoonleella ulvae]|uniref:asparagine synthase (glutamine-hydrolyzing) n=1 Tax=Hyunsoonleella ulvae TaxID=2799948 RepID=UPI00193AC473|nr:asparagine synthase (glutamine-hydrolyzing) [Hyunsoonleella ulvae]
MCGINGFVSSKKLENLELKSLITSMNDLIIHRGPDSHGDFTFATDKYSVGLGMRRLSIIDLSTGDQPMYSEDKDIVIVFNGEIYNYKKLKKELEAEGVVFNTTSDTEIILKLYEFHGTNAFGRLDGMFAFSIYDKKLDKVFIARDFFGEKPLYYTKHNDKFIWASELKSLINAIGEKPKIDNIGLNLYFRLTYIPAPFTIYDGVFKLKPNHIITFDLKNDSYQIDIIDKEERIEKSEMPKEEASLKVRELVEESVDSRSVSDVPIGTFLSGGVDSSVVTWCLAKNSDSKINTFSIGFEKKSYDESDKARIVANIVNSNHHEFILGETDLEDNIDEILLNFDEPFADSSSLPSYLVANKTSQHVKVALTGDGGDEVFGGYNKYYMGKINDYYTRIVPKTVHKLLKKVGPYALKTKHDNRGKRFRINRLLNSIDYTNNYYWDIISLGFSSGALPQFLLKDRLADNLFSYYADHTGISAPNNLTEYRLIDKHISLEGDMLVKVDRTSMLTSLECRAPFLNKKLWQFSNSLPEEFLMNKTDKKHILKVAFEDAFPDNFLNNPKSGFGVPVGDWLRNTLKTELLSYCDKGLIEKQHIFDYANINNLVKEHINGNDHTFKVWSFYCFQKWYFQIYTK